MVLTGLGVLLCADPEMTRACQMLLAVVLSLLAVSSASAAWPSDGSYLVGSSFRADMQRLDVLQALGSTHARLYAHFKYVVPTLNDVDPTLTVATVDANFAQYSSWLNEQANWKMMDKSGPRHTMGEEASTR